MKLVLLITPRIEAGLGRRAGLAGRRCPRRDDHPLARLARAATRAAIRLGRAAAHGRLDGRGDGGDHRQHGRTRRGDHIDRRGRLVDPLIAAANEVLGDLTAPNHGILFVLPVERAIGVYRHSEET